MKDVERARAVRVRVVEEPDGVRWQCLACRVVAVDLGVPPTAWTDDWFGFVDQQPDLARDVAVRVARQHVRRAHSLTRIEVLGAATRDELGLVVGPRELAGAGR